MGTETLRWLTDDFAASPQLMPEDMPDLAAAGIKTVICNRPDMEVPPPVQAAAMRGAAEAAGMAFVDNPMGQGMPSPEQIAAQSAPGPVAAYCASGTRSTVLWALSQVGTRDADDILERTAAAGYPLEGLRPLLTR